MDERNPNFISTFSPYNDNSVGSFHFDGTNDVITVSDQADLRLGTGEFTVEFWFYMNEIKDSGTAVIVRNVMLEKGGYQRNNSFLIAFGAHDYSGTTADRLYVWDQSKNGPAPGPAMLSYSGTITTRKWYHVAFTRDGTNAAKLWVNGDLADTETSVTTDYGNTSDDGQDLHLGTPHQASYRNFNGTSGTDRDYQGFLSDIRIVKGHDVYTAAFTPPTTALTNISGTGYSTVFLAQPGNNVNLNGDTAAPEERIFASFNSAGANNNLTLSANNTKSVTGSSQMGAVCGTVLRSSGKWYWEYLLLGGAGTVFGIANNTHLNAESAGGARLYLSSGNKRVNPSTDSSYGSSYTTNDIIGVALDMDNGAVYFSKNGTFQASGDPTSGASMTNAAFTGLTVPQTAFAQDGSTGTVGSFVVNFGQDATFDGNVTPSGGTNADNSFPDTEGNGSFRYAPPAGYNAITTMVPTRAPGLKKAALKPEKHFGIMTYASRDSSLVQFPHGYSFRPDFLWVKNRTSSDGTHWLYDTVRGFTSYDLVRGRGLTSSENAAEGGDVTLGPIIDDKSEGVVAQYDLKTHITIRDGNSAGIDTYNTNRPGSNYVVWGWKAGEEPVFNTDGNNDSMVSVNKDAGFSIVGWKSIGGSSNPDTWIGHGLKTVPDLIIIKNRDSTENWHVYTNKVDGSWDYLYLDTTAAKSDSAYPAATSDYFYWISSAGDDYVAYCWYSVEGYSKIGSYEGNGNADGPFIYLGFKPAWLLLKNADSGSRNWQLLDNKRSPINPVNDFLRPNAATAENSNYDVDFLSNGFKIRATDLDYNEDGDTFIYMAFAETPSAFTNSR